MRPEDLVTSIEEAFAGLDRPSPEEMAIEGSYVDRSFLNGVGSRTWQELRPLRRFVGDGSEIVLLSAKAYQYYLPAYLVALVDEPAEEFYLSGVLDSLCYEDDPPSRDRQVQDLFDPRKGFAETLRELETEMPSLTDQDRRAAAETRVSVAAKLARIKELTGHDSFDESCLRAGLRELWEERIPPLTGPQKRCIAQVLVRILERTADPFDAPRIQTALDVYWGRFLQVPDSL